MKKGSFLLIVIMAVSCFVGCGSVQNRLLLQDLVGAMEDAVIQSEGVEYLDTCSTYGKLAGNGNGIEFCGAFLVKATSEEAVQELVQKLKDEDLYEIVGYQRQTDKEFAPSYLDHWKGSFDGVDETIFQTDEGSLYSVYFFTTHEGSNPLDIKGH